MSLLDTRQGVIATYLELAGGPALASRLERLPPHLCASIVFKGDCSDSRRDFTGLTEPEHLFVRHSPHLPPLCVPSAIEHAVLHRVGLAELEPTPVQGRRLALLQASLELARQAPPEVGAAIAAFLGMLCWLRPKAAGVPPVSSTSFYEFPHCVFVTDLATRHVAPNVIFAEPSAYALLDNLYHEALHQQLIATMHRVRLVVRDASGADTVEVPWRRERWDVEHALHALLVYRRLADLRRAMKCSMTTDVARTLEGAVEDASGCAQSLKASLLDRSTSFTPAGLSLCASL